MLLFELLQVAVGRRDRLSFAPSKSEWLHLYQLSEQHALLGVCFAALQRLPNEQWPDEETLVDWIWQAQRISERNAMMTECSLEAVERLQRDGFDVCLLKGQGNAMMYGEMADYRQAGDIDLWVTPRQEPQRQPKRRVVEYVQKKYPKVSLRFHHIDFPCFDDAEVEIHFVPNYLNNFWLNHRLKIWFERMREDQMMHLVALGEGQIAVPTIQFNAFCQLLHIYHHVFEEGLGLRQMMDYYYVLTAFMAEASAEDIEQYRQMISRLKLQSLAGAVMYVIHEVFGFPVDQLPYSPNRSKGIALLSDMMQAGNFGHFDNRYEKEKRETGSRAMIHRYWRKTKRNLLLAFDYPHEALWEPVFRLFHFFWRTFNLWKI